MRRCLATAWLAVVLVAVAAAAQTAKDSKTEPAASGAPAPVRAAWLSDRVPLRVGDLITVVVDEQTAARQRVSRLARGDRGLRGGLKVGVQGSAGASQNTAMDLSSGLDQDSRDEGETRRQGDLTAVLSLRVTAFEPGGLARVAGSRKVSVDGQVQEIALQGLVRPEDVSPTNIVSSSRISDAVITYKGKKIGPRTGIAGRFLGMLWP